MGLVSPSIYLHRSKSVFFATVFSNYFSFTRILVNFGLHSNTLWANHEYVPYYFPNLNFVHASC